MFGWLRKRNNRNIFRYWDGKAYRSADPIAIVRALAAHKELNLELHTQLAAQGDPEALGIAIRATREVFSLAPFDASSELGLTDQEALDLLADFGEFAGGLKKNGNGRPIWQAATAPQSSAED